jgi:SAM-dependent methyltransferase
VNLADGRGVTLLHHGVERVGKTITAGSHTSLIGWLKSFCPFHLTKTLQLGCLHFHCLSRSFRSEIYDWYQTYNGLSHLLTIDSLRTTDDQTSALPLVKSYFPPRDKCRVLILGCGNSTMAEDMVRDGWMGEIVNVDFSPVVIGQMKAKYGLIAEDMAEMTKDTDGKDSTTKKKKKKAASQTKRSPSTNQGSKLKFLCADVTEPLPFENESFDLVLCKGTLDAVLCSAGSSAKALCLVRESVRLLAKGYGVFFLVTYGNPDSRVEFLEHENDISIYWKEVTTHTMTRVRPNGGAR